ncbi:(4Fe-4S)-binding protein [Streptomyces sp. NPDC029721]|uniref:(4Fe-4S)-binding protein n=1 Tax=Streptomyces sp. NPDC029721 TaxID=3157090 RepID=UPI0033CB61E4
MASMEANERKEPKEPKEPKAYAGEGITVTYEAGRCLHAARCVGGLPEVFDTGRRPWIQPDGAAPERVAEVVRRCPSGALQYRTATGPAEEGDRPATVVRSPLGQLFLRGELSVTTASGEVRRETRAVLCACGVSGNQPYCDHSGSCGRE